MTHDGHDNLPTEESAAAIAGRRLDTRSRLLRGALWTLLASVTLGPALAAFVFAVALPSCRIARGTGGPAASPEMHSGEGRAEASAPAGSESLRRLRADESFWKARIDFARKEAISLTLDLVDSTATLDIRGVPVRTCRILKIDNSSALRFLENRPGFHDRLSKPLIVRRETATLPKEPIRFEIAPKDTTEAAKAAMRPLAPEEVDVYFTLYFDEHLAIAVRQSEKRTTRAGSWHKTWMDIGGNAGQAGKAILSLIRSELPQHEIRIEITLSRDDAKAIYRALGPEARVALRL